MRNLGVLFWNWHLKIQRFFLVGASVLIFLFVSATVFMRYVFKVDLYGINEIILIIAFWMYFLGASYGTYTKSHIVVNVLDSYIKHKKSRMFINSIASVLTLIIAIAFTYWSVEYVLSSIDSGAKTLVLQIPMYVSQFSMFVGFVLMTVYFAIELVVNVKKTFTD